jgi:hypothetical protein
MKLKITIAIFIIILGIGCKSKKNIVENSVKIDSTLTTQVKTEINSQTIETDSGYVIEHEVIDYEIHIDTFGKVQSVPKKKFKRSFKKYNTIKLDVVKLNTDSASNIKVVKQLEHKQLNKQTEPINLLIYIFPMIIILLFFIWFLYLKD